MTQILIRGMALAVLGVALASGTLNRAWAVPNGVFVPVTPCRIADTRLPSLSPIGGGQTRTFNVVGATLNYSSQGGSASGCGIPGFATAGVPTVTAVMINVVAVDPVAKGNLLVYPTGTTPGTVSTLNFPNSTTVPLNIANGVIVPVRQDTPGADITVKPSQTTHVLLDVMGYFTVLPVRAELNADSPNVIAGFSENHTNDSGTVAATIAGGGLADNPNVAAIYGTVSGGYGNYAGANAAVAGGNVNLANGSNSAIGGGAGNIANEFATVVGGLANHATGYASTVLGGQHNSAVGEYSVALGNHANAAHDGSFIFADRSSDLDYHSDRPNQAAFRATGGFYITTGVDGTGKTNAGVQLMPGDTAWAVVSDRAAKTGIEAIDAQQLLARLAEIPIARWNYKWQDTSIRHIGPMAQDFHAAFGVGRDDKHISTIDEEGVALAAIQGLYRLAQRQKAALSEKDVEIERLKARVGSLEETARDLHDLKVRLRALEAAQASPVRSAALR